MFVRDTPRTVSVPEQTEQGKSLNKNTVPVEAVLAGSTSDSVLLRVWNIFPTCSKDTKEPKG